MPSGGGEIFKISPYRIFDLVSFKYKSQLRAQAQKCDSFLISRNALLEEKPPKDIDALGTALLDFVKNNKKRAAYGMALEPSKYDSQDLALISYFLKKFDSFSLIEKSNNEKVSESFGLSCETVLDPVFLIDRRHFDEIAKKGYLDNDGGLMAYILNANKKSEKAAKEISERLNLELMFFHAKSKNLDNYFCEDWLCAIDKAHFIITDSYYGICFSIIYRKPFIAIGDESSDFFNLLKMFGLEERIISKISDPCSMDDIDYEAVYKILESQKAASLSFLKEAVKPFEEVKPFSDFDVLIELIVREGGRISKLQEQIKKQEKAMAENDEKFKLLAGKRGIYLKYWRYKVMSQLTIGDKRDRYAKKRLKYHEMVRKIRSFV
jgi:hypothetical protein